MSANVGIPTQAGHVPHENVTGRDAAASGEVKRFLKNGMLFVLGGLVLYLAVYTLAERLNYSFTERNRFLVVKTAPKFKYDYAILGASHAVVFDFEDMNARLEEMTGSNIINLAMVGAGVVPNRLMLDYFLTEHETDNLVYVVDSFGFNSSQWNEDRLQDVGLYQRAPFDPVLAMLLFKNPNTRPIALDYTLGFSKINNADRFTTDISDDEATRFAKTYRPIKQIDDQRLSYLYPGQPDVALRTQYLAEFESLIRMAQERGIHVTVVKPPVPERWYKVLPNEAEFDQALQAILMRNNVEFHDYSRVANADKYFYNTDHLNREGVLNFFKDYLGQILVPTQDKLQ